MRQLEARAAEGSGAYAGAVEALTVREPPPVMAAPSGVFVQLPVPPALGLELQQLAGAVEAFARALAPVVSRAVAARRRRARRG
jgi:hypothetical protein